MWTIKTIILETYKRRTHPINQYRNFLVRLPLFVLYYIYVPVLGWRIHIYTGNRQTTMAVAYTLAHQGTVFFKITHFRGTNASILYHWHIYLILEFTDALKQHKSKHERYRISRLPSLALVSCHKRFVFFSLYLVYNVVYQRIFGIWSKNARKKTRFSRTDTFTNSHTHPAFYSTLFLLHNLFTNHNLTLNQ